MSGITWRGVACFTALLCVLGVHGQLRSYFFCQGGDQDGFSCQGLADVVTCGSNGTCIEDAYVDPCGNGYRLFQEECDDGNVVDGDGCSSTCKVEKGWRCDMDSAGREPDTCTVICGDGIQRDSGCCAESECSLECDARRGCDDGNTVRDDGCSEQCSIETAFSCWGGDINTTSTCLCSRSRVSAGATHTCAISSLNKLQCWGDPKYGKTITKFPEGTKVATDVWPEGRWMDLDVWVSVNSGSEHNCALKYDGTAMCWGWRGLSKVGDGRIRLPSTPDWERDSQGGYTWRQLALGDAFSCGLLDESRFQFRRVCAPGETAGTGCSSSDRCTGCRNESDWGIQWLERHPCHLSYVDRASCTAPKNHSVVCWGDNEFGQRNVPVHQQWLEVDSGTHHACGVMDNGTARCWGNNNIGQSAIRFPDSKRWLQVVAGGAHTCGIDAERRMHCWGRNREGQAAPPCLDSWLRACAGKLHTCGVHSDLSIECWGSNDVGQGNVPHMRGACVGGEAPGAECDTSADCTGSGRCSGMKKRDWVQLSCGEFHTCAVDKSDAVFCWGSNSHGQLAMPGGKLSVIGKTSTGGDTYDARGYMTGSCL